ncbi:AraC family transcriptional regulator [Limoniibacter endophyticus]|uniref:AraC family transcriptional regulator n=1 Tax=Limoniibacter endophyticus TaxID=1565040 RepID=A0A8J3GI06_9HYPH|nr:AraC family transcriptional regulator [Limoniibacter endophyticus]GHC75282.1 AraC family transcriptional regulator [Limoniibacter endophyticus]
MTNANLSLLDRCLTLVGEKPYVGVPFGTCIDGLTIVRSHEPSAIEPTLYQPMICLVLQGAKEIIYGDRSVLFSQDETAIVTHEVIAPARIVRAEPEKPYVAIAAVLDLDILRSLYAEIEQQEIEAAQAVAAGAAGHEMTDVIRRLLDMVDKPLERRVLLQSTWRELHFRVLLSRHGAMARQLMRLDSTASRIAKSITHIRNHWDATIRLGELARIAGMSESSFHAHFREVTATSPLQYQKALRLFEARRRLTQGSEPVSSVAFGVGYESPTQFSRDYRRAYGMAPSETRG